MVAALRVAGAEVEIACTNDDGDNELNVELNRLVDFQGVPVRFFQRYSPAGKQKITRAIREFAYSNSFREWLNGSIDDYDVVHVHALFSFTSSYAMWLARRRNIAYIAHPIGSLEHWSIKQSQWRKRIFLGLIDKANLVGARFVHFTADSERQQALKVEANIQAVVIPLGLAVPQLANTPEDTLRKENELPKEAKTVLFLGRIHPKKGIELLFEAFAKTSLEDTYLLVAGSGSDEYLNDLESLAIDLKITERVKFLGHVSGQQKTTLLQNSDIFALTSYSENFGIAVLEALAHGTPVLVTEGVALSAAVKEYELGATCDANPNSISSALNELLNDKELAKLGRRGRLYVEQNHDWAALAEQLLATYSTAVGLPEKAR